MEHSPQHSLPPNLLDKVEAIEITGLRDVGLISDLRDVGWWPLPLTYPVSACIYLDFFVLHVELRPQQGPSSMTLCTNTNSTS